MRLRRVDVDAGKELKELREQNTRLKRLPAETELVKDALREVAKDAPIDVKC
ncbi:transposase IS3/IS911 family protein (plasmid) [Mycobacterium ulcerans subsp. shinshuense]|uniref:Transposase IS3/IS911 family protein n=1 Tax=Mycobacterium ulcerans subsp. shinshuense TaxID=1124626 RepID=A0A1B4YA59_MYCUL|nr:transposase IS3/IS911 family protein [Mycobacterium ulcerans subsp. shinshuense]BAV43948.1 transposase IS3/IS911 family protein [Mycobacterium ulcerans subsp. shinshuense]